MRLAVEAKDLFLSLHWHGWVSKCGEKYSSVGKYCWILKLTRYLYPILNIVGCRSEIFSSFLHYGWISFREYVLTLKWTVCHICVNKMSYWGKVISVFFRSSLIFMTRLILDKKKAKMWSRTRWNEICNKHERVLQDQIKYRYNI